MPKKQPTKRKKSSNKNSATNSLDVKKNETNREDEHSSSFPPHLLQDRKKPLMIHPLPREEEKEKEEEIDEPTACYTKKKHSFSSDVTTIQTLYPNAVFVAKNAFTKAECDAWIEHAESSSGFEHVSHPATRIIAHRECGRIQRNDWTMSERLYQRLKPIIDYVSSNVSISNYYPNYKPINCNGNLRLYKYTKGMSFGRHYDGSNTIDQYEHAQTEITVLVYLSSCEGGATRFYPPHSSVVVSASVSSDKKKKKKKKNDSAGSTKVASDGDNDGIGYVPEAGSVLLHVHGDRCLLHEADPVVDGIKYVLRTDIVYGVV